MKKNILYWALYDFANSLVFITFLFYFSQWLVVDQGRPAWWYNATLIVSSALFIITAPILSKKIDAVGKKLSGLRTWSIFTFIFFGGVAAIALFSKNLDLLATILFTLATYTYLICFLYFTPMLNDLSSTQNRSHVSGIGQGANSIGQVAGLLITLPFANGAITLFGAPGRAQTLLPSVILFVIFALPMLLFYKEINITKTDSPIFSLKDSFKKILTNKPLAYLLLAYFFFSDALLTFANNFPLYLQEVHAATDTTKALLTAAILVLASIGAIIFGKIADKKGNLKTLTLILIIWCFIFPAMALIPTLKLLTPVFLIAGILFGPVWAISRSLVGNLATKELLASSYSYYVLAERFATFIGPAVWSGALVMVGENQQGYQAALLSMSGLLIVGLLLMRKIKPAQSI